MHRRTLQRSIDGAVRTVPRRLGHRYLGHTRRHKLHGMCRGAVQQHIDLGVCSVQSRVDDGCTVVDEWHAMCGVHGWTIQRQLNCGLPEVQSRPVPGWDRTDQLLRMSRRMGDGHARQCRRCDLHVVLGRAVQLCVDGGVCAVQSRGVPGSCSPDKLFVVPAWLDHRYPCI